MARFQALLVDSEDASTPGYSWRSVRFDDKYSLEQRSEFKLRRRQNGIPDPCMLARVARVVHPELGDAELTGAYNMGV